MSRDDLTSGDLRQLRSRGLSEEDARAQLALLREPPAPLRLDRPCTPGDGIAALPERRRAELDSRHAEISGRCLRFVPASGAATRMFRDLTHYRDRPGSLTRRCLEAEAGGGSDRARKTLALLEGLPGLAFAPDLREALRGRGVDLEGRIREGSYDEVLEGLLSPEGLDLASLPKGLIPFHDYGDERRTPFEEHLVEAAELFRDEEGRCRLHFTVSPEHLDGFRSLLGRVESRHARARRASYEVGFSVQRPSTDTIALEDDGSPVRLDDGSLLFRPAGHGALLGNLDEVGGDLLQMKNIDNVAPDRLKAPTYLWSRVLSGYLAELQEQIFERLRRLEGSPSSSELDEAAEFARDTLGSGPIDAGSAERLRQRLHRPIRVCGMVRNRGEPGGGPFWVREGDGTLSRQIVESAQVEPDSEDQQRIFSSSTHFNPVFLVCGLRDHRGRGYPLRRFVDPDAVIVTEKTHAGREIRALERPGLWNGAMARWTTVFVEVPDEVFHPVKTVFDLLRDGHRP